MTINGHAYAPTPAQRFRDAVWQASPDELTPLEALVLLAYGSFAQAGQDRAWLTARSLRRVCKMSLDSTVRLRQALVKKGWLEPVDTVTVRGGRATVYRLVVPPSVPMSGTGSRESVPMSETLDVPSVPTVGTGTQPVPMSGTLDVASVPMSGTPTNGKRSDVQRIAFRSTPESVPMSGTGDCKTTPPQRGAYVRTDARAHARAPGEAAAPRAASQKQEQDQNHGDDWADPSQDQGQAPSVDGPQRIGEIIPTGPPADGEVWTREQSMAYMRSILPKGKPLRRQPWNPGRSSDHE